jgi:DNA-binding NtrC family response regulator
LPITDRSYAAAVLDFKRRYWRQMLKRHGNNVMHAAKAAAVNRTGLHRLIVKLGIHRPKCHRGNWGD